MEECLHFGWRNPWRDVCEKRFASRKVSYLCKSKPIEKQLASRRFTNLGGKGRLQTFYCKVRSAPFEGFNAGILQMFSTMFLFWNRRFPVVIYGVFRTNQIIPSVMPERVSSIPRFNECGCNLWTFDNIHNYVGIN